MIREVEGDILLSQAQVIAHGIATHDPFDSGLALALRERFPSMVRDYRHAMHAKEPKTGQIWAWSGVNEDGSTRGIVNLLTQGMQGQGKAARPVKAKLEDVGHALRELAHRVREQGIQSLALPRLATGVGGLNWADVKPLIQQHLGALGVPVLVYEVYRRGSQAEEKL
ncbi:MAG: macro domain-containing protein [Burkholderiaceae bacterium]|jgi:O-acetyl-ADP-ribose deacetylase (regulator of RNase III)|nr:macro domain-containing protein [Burkholderiaceae bacterium]